MRQRSAFVPFLYRLTGLLLLVLALGVWYIPPAGAALQEPPGVQMKETPTGWVPQIAPEDDPDTPKWCAAINPFFDAATPLFRFPALPPADSDFKKWLQLLDESQDRADDCLVTPVVTPAIVPLLAARAPCLPPLSQCLSVSLWYSPTLLPIPPPSLLV